jgi:cytochrome P450
MINAQSAGTLGAPPLPRGRLLDFQLNPIACMRRLYRAFGTVAAIEEGDQRLVFVFGPEYNQRVLSDTHTFHARFFAVRGPRRSAQRRITGALLSMNGEEHKRHRRMVIGPFQKKAIETYRDPLAALATQMVDAWQAGEERDMLHEMTQHMLRVTSSILFGYDVPELAYAIGRKTERWAAMNHEVGIAAFVSDPASFPAYEQLLHMAEDLEKEILAMIELRRASAKPGNDVLSVLLRAQDEQGVGLTDDELIGQAAILFAAAHMTTAYSLSWTLFLIAQHPRVYAELVDEFDRVLHGVAPSFAQLEELPVLDRVVKEAMRVLPASAYSQRVCTEPADLGPFRVAKGTVVFFSQFVTHHMPELFADPERFLPERWRTINPSPYAYLPFAAGPRMCLGGPLAMAVIKVTLPVILQRFRLSVVPGAPINGNVISTMLAPINGIPMRLDGPDAPFLQQQPVTGNVHEMVTLDEI